MTSLTIAIPTYNRNKLLLKNLENLLKIAPNWVDFIVLDNFSENSIYNFQDLIEKYNINNLKINLIRNKVNIGAGANILKCIEYATSDYIWIIGDDDYPKKNCFDEIIKEIKGNDIFWINFYANDPSHQPNRNITYSTNNLIDFLKNLKSINELVFMSNNIYKTSIIKSGIKDSYDNLWTVCPHLVAMLYGLSVNKENRGQYKISNIQLFASINNNKDAKTAWNLYLAFIGILGLYKLDFPEVILSEIIRLLRGSRRLWLNNKNMFTAFSDLENIVGKSIARRMVNNFIWTLMKIDNFRSIISIPLLYLSVFYGNGIRNFYRKIKLN